MLSGFDFSFRSISRLLVLLRYARARRMSRPRAAAACFTKDAIYWVLGAEAEADRVRVSGRENVAMALRQLDAEAMVLETHALRTEWRGDEVTSHWRVLLRSPGTGAAYWKTGYSRLQFRGSRICAIVSVYTEAGEHAGRLDA